MKQRDEGSAPQVGDRLAYMYVEERKKNIKQGDKIEHIDYVKEKGLKPDTEFYIRNQIQNPVAQLFALALEDLEGYINNTDYKRYLEEIIDSGTDEEEATLLVLKLKEKELENLMFMSSNHIQKALGRPIQQRITAFYKK